MHLPKTFQQQRKSASQNRQRSESPKHNSRSRSMESQNQTSVSQTTPHVNYKPSGDPRRLPNWKLTKFSGNPLALRVARVGRNFWCNCASKAAKRYWDVVSKNCPHSTGKSVNFRISLQLTVILSSLGYSLQKVWQTKCHTRSPT